MGERAAIAFYRINNINVAWQIYRRYSCHWTSIGRVQDKAENAIIVPETATALLLRFPRMRKIIYWLSVDNYIINNYIANGGNSFIDVGFLRFLLRNYWFDIIRGEILPKRGVFKYYMNAFNAIQVHKLIKEGRVSIPKADLHIAQSAYVKAFLKKMGVSDNDIVFVREPLEDEYLELATRIDIDKKQNIIAWNARKAYPIAYKLVKRLKKKYTIYELLNVGKRNMIKIFTLSKVFIDIGIHPGRDRPVREAIALASIPIVNIHGGYNLFEDLPIPKEFKIPIYFDHSSLNSIIKEIYDKVIWAIENYEYCVRKLDDARRWILLEKELFLKDVRSLLSRIQQL